MKATYVLGLATVLLCSPQARTDDGKATAKDLIGSYQLVGGEKGGQKIAPERLKDIKVRIAANAITTFDKDSKEVYVATYELDNSRKPCRITLTATVAPGGDKGTKAKGLIETEGDTVKLIYALPGGKAPTEFRTGDKQQMFILKKSGK